MSDIFQPDKDHRFGEGIISNRRNVVSYAINNINYAVGGQMFDTTPSFPNGRPTVDSTVASTVNERFMPKNPLFATTVERPTNNQTPLETPVALEDESVNQTPLNSQVDGSNYTSTEESERLARQEKVRQELENPELYFRPNEQEGN